MKKIKYLIFYLLTNVFLISPVWAASISIKSNTSSVVVGNTVNVTVSVNGSDAAGWEYCLNYDSDKFSLSSPASSCVLGGELAGNQKVTFKLKAKASGTSNISLKNVQVLNDSAGNITPSTGSVTIKARTQSEIEASYSKDANLKNLSVKNYDITPSFDKDTTEYNLEVENDVENITISAIKSDSGASVSGTGEKELSEGLNKFNVVVTAEKGNKKTYTINVTRKELNPITVMVDGTNYNVVRKIESLEAPTFYSETTVMIDDNEVPAFTSEISGYTLVGLKDEEGTIKLFTYDNGNYRLYKQIDSEAFIFIIERAEQLLDNYKDTKNMTINEIDTEVYYDKEHEDDFVLIYGMNASTGESNWYKYDLKDKTFQRYVEDEKSSKTNTLPLPILIIGGVILALAILIIFILFILLSKKDKQSKKLIEYIETRLPKNMQTSKNKNVESKEKLQDEAKTLKKSSIKKEDTIGDATAEQMKMDKKFTDFIDESQESNLKSLEFTDEKMKPLNNTREILQNEATNISKRELRKLEKARKKEEAENLKAMQEDFFATTENNIVDDQDILDDIEDNKKIKNHKR